MFAFKKTNFVLLLVLFATVATSTGCIKEMAQLLYVIKGHKVEPAFTELKDKTVAVVCNSDATAYGPDSLSVTIAKHIAIAMTISTDKITVAAPAKVDEFIEANGWHEDSAGRLGEAVGADYVVVIDVDNYSIHEGATLFKGKSEWTASAYDVAKEGRIVFTKGPSQYSFPKDGRPSIQTSEREFESFYLARLADHISKQFISYDKLESFAEDAILR